MPYRHHDRTYRIIGMPTWITFGILSVIGMVAISSIEIAHMSITMSISIVDSLVFVGQFFIY